MPSFFGTVLCFAGTLGLVISAPFNPSLPTSLPATVPTPTSKCTEQVPSESPVKPEDDCFYRPPENFDWKAAKPGTVLKFRTAPGHPVDDYPAYNILYSTTDSNDKPTYAVTTVFVPKIISSPHALISYQHNYDSADLSLSPSHDIYTQSVSIPIVNEKIHVCRDFVRTYLERGWFVNVPDYEGPTAAFGAGHMAGYATLDSIRATMSRIYRLGMPKHYPIPPKILMYGYSGGALATNWAAVLHPVYAAELKISGAGVGGFFPDMTDTIKRLQGLYVPSLIQGLATMHVEARKPVLDFL
ncbi:secretory lipase-domain-containing protein, partial [Clohesyomyces aquaticus]